MCWNPEEIGSHAGEGMRNGLARRTKKKQTKVKREASSFYVLYRHPADSVVHIRGVSYLKDPDQKSVFLLQVIELS